MKLEVDELRLKPGDYARLWPSSFISDKDEIARRKWEADRRRLMDVERMVSCGIWVPDRKVWKDWYSNVYLKSPYWTSKRDYLLSGDPMCEYCDYRRATNVHHLNYDRLGREHDSDLALLCGWCHAEEHGK